MNELGKRTVCFGGEKFSPKQTGAERKVKKMLKKLYRREDGWVRFMAGVAMACTASEGPRDPRHTQEAAAWLQEVLEIILGRDTHAIFVDAVPYPVTTKAPLLVRLDGGRARLCWYCPAQDRSAMADEIADLVRDVRRGQGGDADCEAGFETEREV